MPAPTVTTWSASILIAVQTTVLNALNAGSAGAKLKLYDASDTLLASMTLNDPAGTVNGTTGQLTIDLTTAVQDAFADATGTCAYGAFTDSDDTVIVSLPAQAGSSAVSGKLVVNSLSIVSGTPVQLISATVG